MIDMIYLKISHTEEMLKTSPAPGRRSKVERMFL
uniref:Uncharacterized protein n=1 Tax=Rhizophora mucronata TaxID=61149 RepID=A0A2P2QME8_RHIMU